MKQKRIALLLAVALTFSQSVIVPASDEWTVTDVQENEIIQDVNDEDEMTQDISDAEVAESSDEYTENADDEVFSSGYNDVSMPGLTPGAMVSPTPEEKTYYYTIGIEGARGDNCVAPESTSRIWTRLEDDNGEISDYRVEVETVIDEETGENYSKKAGFSVEGTDILVTTNSITGYVEYNLKIFVNGKTEPVISEHCGFIINEYAILLDDIKDEDGNAVNPEIDEAININDMNPRLVHYENGSTVEETDYKMELTDYDKDEWTLQENEGQELPTLIRKSKDSAGFILLAKKSDEYGTFQTIVSRVYEFEALNGDDGDDDDDDDEKDEWHNDTSEEESGLTLHYDFPNTIGNGAMLPNSEMIIHTTLTGRNNEPMSNYRLQIVEQSRFGEATVPPGGQNLHIRSKDLIGQGWCYVSVQVSDENGVYKEVFKKDLCFSVDTHMLSPQVLVDKAGNALNPKVGEAVNLAELGIGLMEYRDGTLYPVGDPSLKILVYTEKDEDTGDEWSDFDTNGWTMTTVPGQDLPIMTRTTKMATWFAVSVFEVDESGNMSQIARKIYEFDEVEHEHEEEPAPHVHSWNYAGILIEATCTSGGILSYRCNCGETKNEVIPAKGHTVVKDEAVEPTALIEGKTEGSHCDVCGAIIKKPDTIAKLKPTISLTASSLKMKTGQSTTAFKATGFATGDFVIKVTSNKPDIVRVTNVENRGSFRLTAGKKKGTAKISVRLASGLGKSFKVTVQKKAVKTTKITTTTKTLALTKGETYKKLASSVVVTPVTSKEAVTYSSSDRKVATVSSKGVIKARKAGKAKITVKSGSKKVVVTVKVSAK